MAESFTTIASGQAAINVDLWTVTSYQGQAVGGLVYTLGRQAMVVADPNVAQNAASVQTAPAGGQEFGIVTRPAANAADLVAINASLQALIMEMQQLILLFGGLPATPPAALSGAMQTQ